MPNYIFRAVKLPYVESLQTSFSFLIYLLQQKITTCEACEAFNKVLLEFGYTQKIEIYDPQTYQVHPPQPNPLYNRTYI